MGGSKDMGGLWLGDPGGRPQKAEEPQGLTVNAVRLGADVRKERHVLQGTFWTGSKQTQARNQEAVFLHFCKNIVIIIAIDIKC